MGFQVAYQAPVCGAFIRHITNKTKHVVREGDMFIGNDPYIGALHQNDVQMVGPISRAARLSPGPASRPTRPTWAAWTSRAGRLRPREVFQEGMRIPCVKLIDQGEMREDVLEMILAASRLPGSLGLDIRAFIATLNVARNRSASWSGATAQRRDRGHRPHDRVIRRRVCALGCGELPDGEFHACDFLEHDGLDHTLLQTRCLAHQARRPDDPSTSPDSQPQAPGFINCTRSGFMGACAAR